MEKKEIYKAGMCIMACLFTAFLLILIYVPTEKYKAKKIAEEINLFLDKNGKKGYKAADAVILKSPVQSGVIVFTLKDKFEKDAGFVFFVRITGVCGPVPAVFVCDMQNNTDFLGTFFDDSCLTDMQIAYWISRLDILSEELRK